MKSKIVYLSLCACLALEASENLEAITITSATKSEKRVDGVAASVIVITQEEIQNSHAGMRGDFEIYLRIFPLSLCKMEPSPQQAPKTKAPSQFEDWGVAELCF